MYKVTTSNGDRTVKTVGDALRAARELHAEDFTVINTETGVSDSLSLIDAHENPAISVNHAQRLLSLAGVDTREDDEDGFHWPYAPLVDEAAEALDEWTR